MGAARRRQVVLEKDTLVNKRGSDMSHGLTSSKNMESMGTSGSGLSMLDFR